MEAAVELWLHSCSQTISQSINMSMPSEDEMRKAITERNKSFDGEFYYGVISTEVFCQPSCPSRQAKPENIRFFPSAEAAEVVGFRACKRCRPTEDLSKVRHLVEVAQYIEKYADEKLTLSSLADIAELSPSRLQRVFKGAFGVSPKAYQDAIRMKRFKQSLKKGDGITDAIFSAGFGSVSRVYGEASRNLGMIPKSYRAGGMGEAISYACRNTALGIMVMAATDKGICFVQFADDEESLISNLKDEFPKAEVNQSPAQGTTELDLWMDALDKHISDGSARPDLPLDMRGTAFQMKVWTFLLSIREGDVLSYSELAEKINKPKAARAVASACAKNRIGVLIPCHRILRGDGSLGGYRWGLERKRVLLDTERKRRNG